LYVSIFWFYICWKKGNDEHILVKNKEDKNEARKNFPFIKSSVASNILAVQANYHDTLFPQAQLKNTIQEPIDLSVKNGISKVYIAFKSNLEENYLKNNFVFFYRMANENKQFRSCISSFGVIEDTLTVKSKNHELISFDEYLKIIGNKSVFSYEELSEFYKRQELTIIKFLYCGYFGEGKNVNYKCLKDEDLWKGNPYSINFNIDERNKILKLGGQDVSNIIID
jgi:hypothetical protein